MSLFKNIETINQQLSSREKKRKNFINQVLNGEQDQGEFQELLSMKEAVSPTPEPNDLVSAPSDSAPAAPESAALARRVANGKHSMNDGHGHGSMAEVKGLNKEFDTALQRMIKDSGGKVSITSGYRSIAQQQKIYDLWKAGKHPAPLVAKPGRSNHNHGLAADLKFLTPEAKKWFHANAAKYGLAFPMKSEPWHIEPINAKSKRK